MDGAWLPAVLTGNADSQPASQTACLPASEKPEARSGIESGHPHSNTISPSASIHVLIISVIVVSAVMR